MPALATASSRATHAAMTALAGVPRASSCSPSRAASSRALGTSSRPPPRPACRPHASPNGRASARPMATRTTMTTTASTSFIAKLDQADEQRVAGADVGAAWRARGSGVGRAGPGRSPRRGPRPPRRRSPGARTHRPGRPRTPRRRGAASRAAPRPAPPQPARVTIIDPSDGARRGERTGRIGHSLLPTDEFLGPSPVCPGVALSV